MATEGEPEPKRIRSSEPDLKVVIGSEDDNSGAGDGERKIGGNDGAEKQPASMVTKWYHSQALATKSKYIDTLLAAPMKESESRTITFPDITPATWELMMKFIDNPLASRTMKAKDVVKVATYYDKYEFTGWTELCDHVLEEYFTLSALTPNIDFIVDAVVVAKDANLHKSFVAGMPLIRDLLSSTDVPLGRTAFTVEHMRKLAPLMNETTDDARSRLVLGPVGEHYDLQSSGFPEKFVGDCSEFFAYQTFITFISSIELSGHNPYNSSTHYHFNPERDADNRYVEYSFFQVESISSSRPVKFRFDGEIQNMFIRRRSKEEGWTIILKKASTDVETVVYRVPHSGNLPLPPSNGWVSVHPLTEGRLCLRYRLNGHMVEV
mmetsp:Transcript_9922/g.23496  ORF Transcript_9922/g.23496 Transcript_9922/m.23496 type:complete len:379 (-) Transcript_9922:63-1199(-)